MKLLFSTEIGGTSSFGSVEAAQLYMLPLERDARSEGVLAAWVDTTPQTVLGVYLSGSCTKIFPAVIKRITINVVDLWRFFASHPFPDDAMYCQRFAVADVGRKPVDPASAVTHASDRPAYGATLVAKDVRVILPRQHPSGGGIVKALAKIRLAWQWFRRHGLHARIDRTMKQGAAQ